MNIQERLSGIRTRHLVFHLESASRLLEPRIRVNVLTKRGVQIGVLEYALEWQCFTLCPFGDTIWSKGCLDDVSKALEILCAPAKEKP